MPKYLIYVAEVFHARIRSYAIFRPAISWSADFLKFINVSRFHGVVHGHKEIVSSLSQVPTAEYFSPTMVDTEHARGVVVPMLARPRRGGEAVLSVDFRLLACSIVLTALWCV